MMGVGFLRALCPVYPLCPCVFGASWTTLHGADWSGEEKHYVCVEGLGRRVVVVGNSRKGFLGGWGWAEMMGEELILTQKSCGWWRAS